MRPNSFEDLTSAAFAWLDAADAVSAFDAWLAAQPERIQVGSAMLGIRPPLDAHATEIRHVAAQRAAILRLVDQGEWREPLREGIGRSFELIAVPPPVSVTALIGIGRSNASAAYWAGEGRAFIWLESWLGSAARSGLQDLDLALLPASVAHELGHAFRAALPGTTAPEVGRLAGLRSVWEAWEARLGISLEEAFLEEGLATWFSLQAYPQLGRVRALLMDPAAVDWLDQHWAELLDDRERRWDLSARPVPFERLRDALFFDPGRGPPWTIERPPSKWGYYVGLRWAEAVATGAVAPTLAGSHPPVRSGPSALPA